MGANARQRQMRIPEKLLQIRTALGLSQSEISKRLDFEGQLGQNRISAFESGRSEPPLIILLRYARLAGVYLDVLVDDNLELPGELPYTGKDRDGQRLYSGNGKSASFASRDFQTNRGRKA